MKIRFGVMGCASIAYRHVISAIQQVPALELKAVASRSPDKADTFARRFECAAVYRYDELLKREDIDAVYMPLPPGLHGEWMLKALAAGKHILVEKPLAPDYGTAERIAHAAVRAGLVVMENYMFPFHSQQAEIKRRLVSGEVGDIRLFTSAFGFPPLPPENFRYDRTLGGGALLDCGGYPLKAAQFFFGQDVTVQSAVLCYDKTREVDIAGCALLTIAHQGTIIPAQISFGMDHYYQCNCSFWGNRGKLTATRVFTAAPDCLPTLLIEKQGEKHEYTLAADNHFVRLLNHFAHLVSQGAVRDQVAQVLNQACLIEDIRTHATHA